MPIWRVRPEQVDRLRGWLAELMKRADEVRETFAREGLTHERAYLLVDSRRAGTDLRHGSGGPSESTRGVPALNAASQAVEVSLTDHRQVRVGEGR